MWLESPITFLHCVHEARMIKIVWFNFHLKFELKAMVKKIVKFKFDSKRRLFNFHLKFKLKARMKKIVHLPPPSEKQIYIVQVQFHLCWGWKSTLINFKKRKSLKRWNDHSKECLTNIIRNMLNCWMFNGLSSDKNGNSRHCGNHLLPWELWPEQNKPWGDFNFCPRFISIVLIWAKNYLSNLLDWRQY